MRKLLALMLVLLCVLPCGAGAEMVGYDPVSGYAICHYDVDGENVYYLSKEEDVYAQHTDVNFDGREDLLMISAMGASNAGYLFFMRMEDGSYALANRDGLIWNYELDEDRGLVISWRDDGAAGALSETRVYRWEGCELVPLRQGVSAEKTEFEAVDGGWRETTYSDVLVRRVWACNEDGALGALLWEEEVTLRELEDPARFEQMNDELLKGL